MISSSVMGGGEARELYFPKMSNMHSTGIAHLFDFQADVTRVFFLSKNVLKNQRD